MNIEKIPSYITNAVRKREFTDAEISAMTPEEMFCEYCVYMGFGAWGSSLISVLDRLRAADEPENYAS